MSARELLKELEKLPISQRVSIIKKALKAIEDENGLCMKSAARRLLPDYQTDKELTAFTSLDFDDFYETR